MRAGVRYLRGFARWVVLRYFSQRRNRVVGGGALVVAPVARHVCVCVCLYVSVYVMCVRKARVYAH